MRTRLANIAYVVIISLFVATGFIAVGCRHCLQTMDGPRLNTRLMGADSPVEIEQMIRASFAERCSPKDITEGYTTYQITNGLTRWEFVLAANGPRGLGMLNLYCYEQVSSNNWLLRSYVPLLMHYYTNGVDRELLIQADDDHVSVAFRGMDVFTSPKMKGRP